MQKRHNLSMKIYVNKIKNKMTCKINTYYIELLIPETMKLLGSTKSEIIKDGNDENVLHLEITEIVLVHCNIINNDYEHDSRVFYTFVSNKSFVWSVIRYFTQNVYIFNNI